MKLFLFYYIHLNDFFPRAIILSSAKVNMLCDIGPETSPIASTPLYYKSHDAMVFKRFGDGCLHVTHIMSLNMHIRMNKKLPKFNILLLYNDVVTFFLSVQIARLVLYDVKWWDLSIDWYDMKGKTNWQTPKTHKKGGGSPIFSRSYFHCLLKVDRSIFVKNFPHMYLYIRPLSTLCIVS